MTTAIRPDARGVALPGQSAGVLRGSGFWAPVALAILAASVAMPVLLRLSQGHSDISAQAALAARMVQGGGWISYTLWYPLIYLTSSGSADPALLRSISVSFLVAAVVAKTLAVYYLGWACTRRRGAAAAIALLMLVAMPLLSPGLAQGIYLGNVTANVWHNSTQMFALPFALAAFVAAVALLRAPTASRALLCGLLILISTMAKPNYTLALLPVLGLALLWTMRLARTRPVRQLAVICLAFLPAVLLLGSQYLLVFGSKGVRETQLVVAPLAVWSAYSVSIPVSIGLSIAGPLAVLLVLPKRWRNNEAMVLAWLVLGVSVLQLTLLAERLASGAIAMDGNFFWGSYSAIFMVFLVSAILLARAFLDGPTSRGRRAAMVAAAVVLSLHAGSGIYYVVRAAVTSTAYL
jgi:hypothetical protein